jgi:sulfatase-like protein
LVILGLSGLAVALPLLDLFGRNPDVFVGGEYSRVQIIAFAALIALVPPLIGIALTAVATLIDRRVGTVVFWVVTAALAAAFVLALLRTLDVDSAVLAFTVAVAGGVGAAVLILRTRAGWLFASYLAAANLLFVGLFVFVSPTSDLLAGAAPGELAQTRERAPTEIAPLEGPVVVVVLDEFPAATIMRADGSLNSDRYPGFAELASVSTWFRNASSHYNLTYRAVPQLLSGLIGKGDFLPTYEAYPRTLFTLPVGDLRVRRYEPVTDLCPPSVCAIEDASPVSCSHVLPTSVRDEVPDLDDSSGSSGVGAADESFIDQAYRKWRRLRRTGEISPRRQAEIMADEIAAIDASPAVHFVHVALPHRPYLLSRSGMQASVHPTSITDPDAPGAEFMARFDYQRHSMQVGAVDVLIGDLLDRLRALPTWDDTLLVVTSDHGTNFSLPDLGRMKVTDANRDEVLRIPLFIKAPGQLEGEVRDDSAQTIDLLPSIVDLLGVDVDWEFDGHSLYDGSTAHTEPQVSTDVDDLVEVVERRAEDFPYGDDWLALAAVGENGDLVGRRVDELSVGTPSRYRATLRQQRMLRDLPSRRGMMPYVLVGDLTAGDGSKDEPPELLAAVNGTLAGVVGGYKPDGAGWVFAGYVADFYRPGANEVSLYEVTRDGSAVTLHPVR